VKYTEGVVRWRKSDGLWIPHAWLTDEGGQVIDPALSEPGERYRGIAIPRDVLRGVILASGEWGPALDVLAAEGWSGAPVRRA
jgi:hypothetical protein